MISVLKLTKVNIKFIHYLARKKVLFRVCSGVSHADNDQYKDNSVKKKIGVENEYKEPKINKKIDDKEPTLTTAEAISLATKHYTKEINRAYGDMERMLMERIHESNTRRFRVVLISILLITFWIIAVFGTRIRKMLSEQTAGLARETLENESLKIQTQELATAVVQTVLNDKDVTSHAATFLREASGAAETQEALLKLTLHVLQHPKSIDELVILVKKLVKILSVDEETASQLGRLLGKSLQDPQVIKVISIVFQKLCEDPEILKAISQLTVKVIEQPVVIQATNELLIASSLETLKDDKIQSQAREFVTDVMGDDSLQREGGNAIWNSITHAVKPGLYRTVGFGLVLVSIAFIRVVTSPF